MYLYYLYDSNQKSKGARNQYSCCISGHIVYHSGIECGAITAGYAEVLIGGHAQHNRSHH